MGSEISRNISSPAYFSLYAVLRGWIFLYTFLVFTINPRIQIILKSLRKCFYFWNSFAFIFVHFHFLTLFSFNFSNITNENLVVRFGISFHIIEWKLRILLLFFLRIPKLRFFICNLFGSNFFFFYFSNLFYSTNFLIFTVRTNLE